MAVAMSSGVLQRSFVATTGASGATSRRAGVRVERHGLDAAGQLGRGRGEDGVEPGEDAAAGGRVDQAALGHHQADRRAEPERLAPITPYDRASAPLRLLPPAGAVLPGRLHRGP
ncbi:hypothetical protein ACFWXK_25065 [Streptomyces sp. NPDC059070]|uniref:hypothetical protein n=1 Tax=Streptomyces sp. NPDC059070 TaxID=3346713 RepID=UPI003681468A